MPTKEKSPHLLTAWTLIIYGVGLLIYSGFLLILSFFIGFFIYAFPFFAFFFSIIFLGVYLIFKAAKLLIANNPIGLKSGVMGTIIILIFGLYLLLAEYANDYGKEKVIKIGIMALGFIIYNIAIFWNLNRSKNIFKNQK